MPAFSAITLLDVSMGQYPALGRANVMWTVDAAPAGGFELAIQKNGVNIRVRQLAGVDTSSQFLDLPNDSYVAVLSAKNAAGLVVVSQSKAFTVNRATNVSGLAALCDAATGNVSVSFTPIAGYSGQYHVVCDGVEKDVTASPVSFPFVSEGLKAVSISASIDSFALSESTSVQVDRKVVINTFTVTQDASQQKQGKATIAYSQMYKAADTTFDLEVSGGSWSLNQANIASGAEINMAAGTYDFRLVAKNPLSGHKDANEMVRVNAKVIFKNAAFTDAAVAGNAAGIISISASPIGATGSDYTFDVSGAEQAQPMRLNNASGKWEGSIVKPNGAYQLRINVTNNGAVVHSAWMNVTIAKTTVISGITVDKKKYAGLGKVELKWAHVQSAANCEYTAKLLKAADGSQVGASATRSIDADAPAGDQALELDAPAAGAYVARLEVVINNSTFHDEVIVYLENTPLAMNLQAFAANRSADSNLTNPYDLWFTRDAGLTGSLFEYSWSLVKAGALGGPDGIIGASTALRFDLPRTASLPAGNYTLSVSTMLYGNRVSATKSFMVGGVAHTPVIVDLDVALDARADAAVIDSSQQIIGNIVEVKTALPAAALYSDVSNGLIEFWEPSNAPGELRGRFTVNEQGSAEPNVYNGLQHAKDLVMGIHACLNGPLDCSAAEPFARMNNDAYDQFASVGDMTLAYIADKLFGHPAATAAITNDSMIKDTMNAAPAANAAALNLGTGAIAEPLVNTATEAGNQKLALRLVQTMLFHEGAARAKRIAESVIGQDADRARDADNNQLTPDQRAALPFYAGDIIFFTLNLKSLDVFQGRIGQPVYQQLKARLADQSFVFKITLA